MTRWRVGSGSGSSGSTGPVRLAAPELSLRADLLPLHGAGDRRSTACCGAAGWASGASRAVTPGTRAATTRSVEREGTIEQVSFRRPRASRVGLLLLVVLVALVLAACAGAPAGSPGASGGGLAHPTPVPTPLHPAPLGADPFSLLAFLFTPIFQVVFIILIGFYKLIGDRPRRHRHRDRPADDRHPRSRSSRCSASRPSRCGRPSSSQPEVKEIQRRNKGDRQAIFDETQAMYR